MEYSGFVDVRWFTLEDGAKANVESILCVWVKRALVKQRRWRREQVHAAMEAGCESAGWLTESDRRLDQGLWDGIHSPSVFLRVVARIARSSHELGRCPRCGYARPGIRSGESTLLSDSHTYPYCKR